MEGTTILVSKKFHDWLKNKGKKGENYEDIIKNMLKPEFLQELKDTQESAVPLKEERLKPKIARQNIKELGQLDYSLESKTKPTKLRVPKSQRLKISEEFKKPKAPPAKLKKENSKPIIDVEKPKSLPKPKIIKKRPEPKVITSKTRKKPLNISKKFPTKPRVSEAKDEHKQWVNNKNLELQGLKIEFELAKLSNDTAKMRELAALISKLKEDVDRKKDSS